MNNPSSSVKDNYLRGKVVDFLKEIIEPESQLSFITAFFTIYAFDELKDELSNIDHLDLLFGEPRFIQQSSNKVQGHVSFHIEEDEIAIDSKLQQQSIAKECAEWIRNKVDVRSFVKSNLLHGKMYHATNPHNIENAILGSSNFTCSGLGIAANQNIELNLELSDRRDIQDLKAWFDEIWNNPELVKDVKSEVLKYLEQLYKHNSPEFVYYKTLYQIFNDFLEEREADEITDREKIITETEIWNYLFEFQRDGVKGAINKLKKYNGCIIADSVGLGKTYEALAVIKYFELLNYRVLVLCPKKLSENWTQFQASVNSKLNPFLEDRFAYTVLSHTDLSRESGMSGNIDLAQFNWGNYDLVVIDESHNFRNATLDKKGKDGKKRKSRYNRLMEEVIQGRVQTKVLLLSATPVNNTLKDLRNQIYFITEKKDNLYYNSLGIPSIDNSLRIAQQRFATWAKKTEDRRDKRELLNNLPSSFFKLLDALSIARSRNHIKKYYSATLDQLGGFPKRTDPQSITSEIDKLNEFPSYDGLNTQIEGLHFTLYNPSKYLIPKYQALYELDGVEAFTQVSRENFLIGMMRVNYLKRLESSVSSFTLTLKRTLDKIDATIEKIDAFRKFQEEQTNASDNMVTDGIELQDEETEEDEELAEAFSVGSKLRIRLEHLRTDEWKKDLLKDREDIQKLYDAARVVTPSRDAKLEVLKDLIQTKALNPTIDKTGAKCRKVIIFTAFSDTAEYIYSNIKEWCQAELGVHVGLVSGSGQNATFGQNKFMDILNNFSPISHHRESLDPSLTEEIDILVATDCVSEGQNLQDCDLLINFDIHWNPVRIIQRFGRIDRIGSNHKEISLVNFWPTNDLEKYINLKTRVEARMTLVDITATGEDDLLNKEGIVDVVKEDLKFRDKQLLRLRDEILDLEDFNDNVTLSEFTLDDFRLDLLRYLDQERDRLENSPLGLNAIVPTEAEHPSIRPGVIFCLKKTTMVEDKKATASNVNPLSPYYLVYILYDGNVRYSFTHAKQILDIFRTTCVGKNEPIEEICDLFDQQTDNGRDMSKYEDLLKRAARKTKEIATHKSASSIGSDRNMILPTIHQQFRAETDLELISWLIIMEN